MKIKDKNRPDFKILHTEFPMIEHNGVEHCMVSRMYSSYNNWLEEMYEQDAKVIYLHSMHHQLDLDKDNKVMNEYRYIIHWVRYCIVEKYDEDNNILDKKYRQDPDIEACTYVEWIKREK